MSTTFPAADSRQPDNTHKVYNVNTFVDINTSADVKGLQILVHEKEERMIGSGTDHPPCQPDTCTTWITSTPVSGKKRKRKEDDLSAHTKSALTILSEVSLRSRARYGAPAV